jgi:hypothetical protein
MILEGLEKFFKFFSCYYNTLKLKYINDKYSLVIPYKMVLSNKIKDFSFFPSPGLFPPLQTPKQSLSYLSKQTVDFKIMKYTNLHYDKRHHPQFDT